MGIEKINNSVSGNLTTGAVQSASQAADNSFETHLKAAVEKNDDKELKNVCQQFEGIMLDMMYKQMKTTIIKSDLVEEDAGREIFQSMLDENLMEQASKTGSFGLAESLYKQLSKQSASIEKKNDESKTIEESQPVDK
jgi:peptidoglycan hydrolase FlgJ